MAVQGQFLIDDATLWVDVLKGGIRLRLRVTSGSRRSGFGDLADSGFRLAVRVSARPVEGEANKAVEALLAKALGIPKGRVAIVRGQRGRDKTAWVEGDPEALAVAASQLPEMG